MPPSSPFHIRQKLRQHGRTASELRAFIRNARLLAQAMAPAPVEVPKLLKLSLRYPALFKLTPEALRTNVTRSATLLGLTEPQFIRAALCQPQLFWRQPDALGANASRSALALGVK